MAQEGTKRAIIAQRVQATEAAVKSFLERNKIGQPKENKSTTRTISSHVSPELNDWLTAKAAVKGISVSRLISNILEEVKNNA